MRHAVVISLSILVSALLSLQAQSQNLLLNPGFDDDILGWTLPEASFSASHQDLDVAADGESGSAQVTNSYTRGGYGDGLAQCVPVSAGSSYDFGTWAYIPSGQAPPGDASGVVFWYSSPDCGPGTLLSSSGTDAETSPTDTWILLQRLGQVAPSGARSAKMLLDAHKSVGGGSFTVLFDDPRFCPSGTCALSFGPFLSSVEMPGFRVRVTIETADEAFAGAQEPVCLSGTICASGAVAGRTEVQLRVIGPRPNGYLWFQVARFTPSRLVLLAEQLSTGVVRAYVLEAVKPGRKPTNLEDRTAFVP